MYILCIVYSTTSIKCGKKIKNNYSVKNLITNFKNTLEKFDTEKRLNNFICMIQNSKYKLFHFFFVTMKNAFKKISVVNDNR